MVDSQAILIGAPGEGKSFVALSFALSVAAGRKWLGREVKHGPVVYVAAEGSRGMKKRVRAWQKEHFAGAVNRMFFIKEAPQLRSDADLKALLSAIQQHRPILVVLDTLARTMVGADENAAKDVGEWVAGAHRIQKATGATVLTLHHTIKRKGKAVTERGSSALRGAVDTMLAVVKKDDLVTLSCQKQKDAEEFAAVQLLLKAVEVGVGQNGPEKSLVVTAADSTAAPTGSTLTQGAITALRELTGIGGPIVSKADWKKAVDAELGSIVADRTFMNWVDELLKVGNVVRVKRGFYQLAAPGSATATEVPTAAINKAA